MSSETAPTEPFLKRHIELIIAIMLGLIAVVTAYASFQSALYDGQMTQKYTIGSNLATEAESLYLEGNQQYQQDNTLWNDLTLLTIDIDGTDPAAAELAQQKYDTLVFQSVSEDFQAAIDHLVDGFVPAVGVMALIAATSMAPGDVFVIQTPGGGGFGAK